jgi:tRNA(Ile2) C34 agmatinyltransferase TiaS
MSDVRCPVCSVTLRLPESATDRFQCPKCGSLIELQSQPVPVAHSYRAASIGAAPRADLGAAQAVCPFCREAIQSEAVKCKHCGERLNGNERQAPNASGQQSLQSQESQPSSELPPVQPGKVQGLAIMILIGGILAIFLGLFEEIGSVCLWILISDN